MKNNNKLNVSQEKLLVTPSQLFNKFPITLTIDKFIQNTRIKISKILKGEDKRLLVIIGPCSIHDPISAVEYAEKISFLRKKYSSRLEIIMRVYFEKPRTVVGWKGLIYDPDLNNTLLINKGLNVARKLLLKINKLSVPCATEFLDIIISKFILDLISWGAIGARTTESQIHREMASYLPCPIGFKNGTDGNVSIAIDAIRSSKESHLLLLPNGDGKISINYTSGNPVCNIIMRGGIKTNYHKKDINSSILKLRRFNLPEYLIVDFSHANSSKEYYKQLKVANSISEQIYTGSNTIVGVMIESFLKEGSQNINDISSLKYGQSITDACLGWEDSEFIIEKLANAVDHRF